MKITSPAFANNGSIPRQYTCQGKGINPPLEFHAVPPNAKSLVLIMDDPDVPSWVRADCMYDHWIVFDILPETKMIPEHAIPRGVHGKNTQGKDAYTGPCPPDREHRYFFKLYALDTLLELPKGSSKKQVEKAMHGHIVAEAHLMGRYEKDKGY